MNQLRTEAVASDALETAVEALQCVDERSLPAQVTAILSLTCSGLGATRATLWRLSGDGKALRRFCSTAGAGAAITTTRLSGPLARAMTRGGLTFWVRDGNGLADLANQLGLASTTREALVLPVRLYGTPLGMICVELGETAVPAAASLFLQLAASRIEGAYIREPSVRRADEALLPLGRSHQSLTDDSLRNLFYFAPVAMMLTEPDSARPLAANRHALELLRIGGEAGELRATRFWEDATDREVFVREVMARGTVRSHRAQLRRADGEAFWAVLSATLIDYEGTPALMTSITDVSDMVAAEEVLNRTQKTLMTLLEASPLPLVVTRLDDSVIRYANQRAAEMFEMPVTAMLGRTAPEFYADPSDRGNFVEKLRGTGKVEGFIARLKARGGEPFWAMLSARTLELNGESVFVVAFADVTRQKNKEAELETLAFKDGLTGAWNRRYFIEAARIELARAERSGRPPALALIDIDHFKRLNDTRGHETGDNVLREFVALVQELLRKTDIFARYGGEEFAILFPETDVETAHAIVERIRLAVEAHPFCGSSKVTFSAGLVEAHGDGYQSLMEAADDALYTAKRRGRNRISLVRPAGSVG